MKSILRAGFLLTGLSLAMSGCASEAPEAKHESPEKAEKPVEKSSSLAPPGLIEPSTAVSMPPTGKAPDAMPDEAKPKETPK